MSSPMDYIYAIYPYDKATAISYDGIITFNLPAEQHYLRNSFGYDANTMVSVSNSNMIQFKNAGSYLSLRFYGEGIKVKSIKLKGNNGEKLAGKAMITMPLDGTPTVNMQNDATDEIILVCDKPVVLGADENSFIDFWLVLPPTAFSNGFTVTVTDHRGRTFTKSTSSSLSFGRNTLLKMKPVKVTIDTSESDLDEGGTESGGLYLGIAGFNSSLSNYPIGLLNMSTKSGFDDFIDGLTMTNGTLLYYSVNNALDRLQSAICPRDLFNVSLVTFTDGLDRGTPMMIENYPGNDAYLDYLHNRIVNDRVSSLTVTAWAVGIKGEDVTNEAQFNNNLNSIATSSSTAYRVNSMAEVNSRFQEIADHLNGTSYIQKITVEIPGEDNGTKIRFTLDGATSAANSKKYIEGTFNLNARSLENITYHGVESSSGSTVQGSVNGIFVAFNFEGIVNLDEKLIEKEKLREWLYQGGVWVKNSEFVPDEKNVTIMKEKRSILVLLNLDCSTSIGNDFSNLKNYAKSFIAKLGEATIDESYLESLLVKASENLIERVNDMIIYSDMSTVDSTYLIAAFVEFAKAREAYLEYTPYKNGTEYDNKNLFYHAYATTPDLLVDSIAFTDLTIDLVRQHKWSYGYDTNGNPTGADPVKAFYNIAKQMFGTTFADAINGPWPKPTIADATILNDGTNYTGFYGDYKYVPGTPAKITKADGSD